MPRPPLAAISGGTGAATAAAALAVLLTAGVPASAQVGTSLSRAGSGARAAGMGDAFVAISDDGTAASWNPAGLAQLRQPEFSIVYVVSNRGLDLSGMRSPDQTVAYGNQNYQYTNSSLDFASAALPFSIVRRPVTIQGSWHRLYQLSSDMSGNVDRIATGENAPTTLYRSDRVTGDIDVFSVAGAVKVTSRTLIGGSVDWFRGEWNERLLLANPVAGADPRFLAAGNRSRVHGTVFAGGLLVTYPAWTVGLVYHSPAWSSFAVSQELASTGMASEVLEAPGARFRWPRSIAAGLAHRWASHWTASLATTHDQWTDTLVDRFPGNEGPVNFFDGAAPGFTTTRDTLSFNAGAERLFVHESVVVPLRFGVGYEPQGGMDPVTRDPVDQMLVSLGGGYNTNRVKIDAAVQYRWAAFRTTDRVMVDTFLAGDTARDSEGRAGTNEWRIKISAIYRIQDTDKLRSILRKIFG